MKRLILFLAIFWLGSSLFAQDYQEFVKWENNVGIRYRIISTNPRYVAVVDPNGEDGWGWYDEVTRVEIPGYVEYENSTYIVKEIDYGAFSSARDLQTVIIPNTVTSIGEWAFTNCSGLTSVTIPNSVTTIGSFAFNSCSGLQSVTIPNSVTAIGRSAFSSCSGLTNISIPNSVSRIEDNTFSRCTNLTSLDLPSSITYVGRSFIGYCSNLATINIASSTPPTIYTWGFDECPQSLTIMVPCGSGESYRNSNWNQSGFSFQEDCHYLYYELNGDGESVAVYGNDEDNARWEIAQPGNETHTIIPASVEYENRVYPVTRIGASAFLNRNDIVSVSIPESVSSIGASAFSGCSSLENIVVMAEEVPTTVQNTFDGCAQNARVEVPCGSRGLYAAAIGWNHFTNIIQDCSRTMYCTINSNGTSVTVYNQQSLSNDRLAVGCGGDNDHLIIPRSVDYNNQSYTVSEIGTNAFIGASYTSITIPTTVTKIGNNAFQTCIHLTEIIIPNSVINIGTYAFQGCSGLRNVVLGNSVSNINTSTFNGCSHLENVSIPNSVREIYTSAFQGCTSLTGIDLPNSVTSIGSSAFSGCTGLSSIELPNSVISIGSSAFSGCTGLSSIELPNSVISIGSSAFNGCTSLNRIDLPNSITTLESNAFQNCTNLTSVILPNSITTISSGLFWGCSSLNRITIPNRISSIGSSSFYGCESLTSVVIPSSVTLVGGQAFSGCSNLYTIYSLASAGVIAPTAYTNSGVKRVVPCESTGSGMNTLYKIINTYNQYTVANKIEADCQANQIPKGDLPNNFIYSNDRGTTWLAKNIVLVDDTCRFFSPVAFTADNATYTRTFANNNRSTLYLPFTAAKSNCDGLEVYEFTNYSNGTLSFRSLEGDNVNAYTPYLVGYGLTKDGSNICSIEQPNAVFPATAEDAGAVTKVGMTFHGTMKRTDDLSNNCYGYKDGYFVQSGGHAHVNPFRCYFTLSGSQSAPQTLSVDTDGDYLGIEDVDGDMEQTSIRYSNDVYDMMGRLVRKDAESLRGLPKGIYIWRGKKQIAF